MKRREVPAVRRILGEVGPERIVRVVSKETELKKEELLRGIKAFHPGSFDGIVVSVRWAESSGDRGIDGSGL